MLEGEVHGDDGGYIYGLVVDEVGAIAPGAYGVFGGAAQEMMTLKDLQALDGSVFGDDGLHDDLSLHVGDAG